MPVVPAELRGTHTAGPIAALESAVLSGRFARARRILFLSARSGLTVAAALYERGRIACVSQREDAGAPVTACGRAPPRR